MPTPDNAPQLVNLLTASVKSGDGGDFIGRFLQGWQDELFDHLMASILQLQQAHDPFRMPLLDCTDGRTTVDHALWLVGFTDELEHLVRQLTVGQKRLLLSSAAALWKRKGVPWGWIRWIRLLTGVPAWFMDYRTLTLLTEDGLGALGCCVDPVDVGSGAQGAYESNLWVEDPQDATLRDVIGQLVNLTRPASERVRVRWPDVLEVWDRVAALSRWMRSGATLPSLDLATRQLHLTAGQAAHCIARGLTWKNYSVLAQVTLQAGCECYLDLHWSDTTHWFRVALDSTTQRVRLQHQDGGVVHTMATEFPVPWPPDGVPFRLEATIGPATPGVNGKAMTAWIDGEPVASWLNNAVLFSDPDDGYPGFTCVAGTMDVGRFIAYDLPLEYYWAAPAGAVDDEA